MQKKSLETILYSTVGVIGMLVVLVLVNFILGFVRQRADLTQEKAYTLRTAPRPSSRSSIRPSPSASTARRASRPRRRLSSSKATLAKSRTCSPNTSRSPAAS